MAVIVVVQPLPRLPEAIRIFLNYGANDYIEFKGESVNILIYEPPFTKSKTEDQLREFIGEKLHLDISSNSVTTERIIRDMSSVAATTTSAERRDGLISSDSSGM